MGVRPCRPENPSSSRCSVSGPSPSLGPMFVEAEVGPADACRTHRRPLQPSAPVHVLIRWGGLMAILLFMLALPYLYFQYRLWLRGTPLRVAEFAILGTTLG